MKTTLDIADAIFDEVKTVAKREKTTMRALVEEGLRRILGERNQKKNQGFRLRQGSFKGKGINAQFKEGSWTEISDLIYDMGRRDS